MCHICIFYLQLYVFFGEDDARLLLRLLGRSDLGQTEKKTRSGNIMRMFLFLKPVSKHHLIRRSPPLIYNSRSQQWPK